MLVEIISASIQAEKQDSPIETTYWLIIIIFNMWAVQRSAFGFGLWPIIKRINNHLFCSLDLTSTKWASLSFRVLQMISLRYLRKSPYYHSLLLLKSFFLQHICRLHKTLFICSFDIHLIKILSKHFLFFLEDKGKQINTAKDIYINNNNYKYKHHWLHKNSISKAFLSATKSKLTCHCVRQGVHKRCPQGSSRISLSFSAQILQSWKVEPISQYNSYCSCVTLMWSSSQSRTKKLRSGLTLRPSGYRKLAKGK